MVNLSDDVLEPLNPELLTAPTHVRLIFILDKSKSMGKAFSRMVMPACSMLYRRLTPDSTNSVFFGETVTSSVVNNVSFFEENANMELEGVGIFWDLW